MVVLPRNGGDQKEAAVLGSRRAEPPLIRKSGRTTCTPVSGKWLPPFAREFQGECHPRPDRRISDRTMVWAVRSPRHVGQVPQPGKFGTREFLSDKKFSSDFASAPSHHDYRRFRSPVQSFLPPPSLPFCRCTSPRRLSSFLAHPTLASPKPATCTSFTQLTPPATL